MFFRVEQAFKTEIDILLLPKNEKTAQSFSQTVESIKQLPLSLSFYDKMLEANKDIKDGAIGEMDYKRKEFWNKKINAQRIDESGVIRFEIFDKDRWQSEIIAFQLKNDIFFLISKYYNIKTDLEPRLIDGPITGSAVSGDIWKSTAKSAGLGILIAFLLTVILSGLATIISRKKEDLFNAQYSFRKDVLPEKELQENKERDLEYHFPKYKSAAEKALAEFEAREAAYHQRKLKKDAANIPENNSVAKEIEDGTGSRIESGMTVVNKPTRTVTQNVAEKKASAPSNLPFTEEELPEIFNVKSEEVVKKETTKENVETSYKEATPEEVQERIAKLLNIVK
jgi:hypothetical protein